jgi:arylsulfatase A-like enzyme
VILEARQQASITMIALVVVSASASPRPHLVMLLGDDLGWANVGWHHNDTEVVTPSLNHLVTAGIELDSMYAFKYCSPSRSALQTGRNPIHVNVVNPQTTIQTRRMP